VGLGIVVPQQPARCRREHELSGVDHAERDQQQPERLPPRARGEIAPVVALEDPAVGVGAHRRPVLSGTTVDPALVVTGDLNDPRVAEQFLGRCAGDAVDA
jgi:hypothetical protein